MAPRERLWLVVPRQLRALPVDLGAALVVLFVTDLVVLLPVLNETSVLREVSNIEASSKGSLTSHRISSCRN